MLGCVLSCNLCAPPPSVKEPAGSSGHRGDAMSPLDDAGVPGTLTPGTVREVRRTPLLSRAKAAIPECSPARVASRTPRSEPTSREGPDAALQFHVLAFEGPDAYARAGGIASRITGLSETLADAGFGTHLW